MLSLGRAPPAPSTPPPRVADAVPLQRCQYRRDAGSYCLLLTPSLNSRPQGHNPAALLPRITPPRPSRSAPRSFDAPSQLLPLGVSASQVRKDSLNDTILVAAAHVQRVNAQRRRQVQPALRVHKVVSNTGKLRHASRQVNCAKLAHNAREKHVRQASMLSYRTVSLSSQAARSLPPGIRCSQSAARKCRARQRAAAAQSPPLRAAPPPPPTPGCGTCMWAAEARGRGAKRGTRRAPAARVRAACQFHGRAHEGLRTRGAHCAAASRIGCFAGVLRSL